jgi:hypothetical protein
MGGSERGGNTPYALAMRNGDASWNRPNNGRTTGSAREMASTIGQKGQPRLTHVLNSNNKSTVMAKCTMSTTSPAVTSPARTSARTWAALVFTSRNAMHMTTYATLKKPQLPVAWMPIMSATSSTAPMTRGQPGNMTSTGATTSATNMKRSEKR